MPDDISLVSGTVVRLSVQSLNAEVSRQNSDLRILGRPIAVIDTAYITTSFGTSRYCYTYDNDLNRIAEIHQVLTDSGWQNRLRITYPHDKNRKVLFNQSEEWRDSQWVKLFLTSYTYDNRGNQLSRLDVHWLKKGEWANDLRFTYTYDTRGNLCSLLDERWMDNQWVNHYHDTSIYDTHDRKTIWLSGSWSNDHWDNTTRTLYTYDKAGNEVSELIQTFSNDSWLDYLRYSWTYNNERHMLSKLYQTADSGKLKNQNLLLYGYEHGQLVEEVHEYWWNNRWEETYKIFYTYDLRGHCLSETSQEWKSDHWEYDERGTYSFDANGNQLSYLHEFWEFTYWRFWSRYTYRYDDLGNLV
jgi:hypothetical protein